MNVEIANALRSAVPWYVLAGLTGIIGSVVNQQILFAVSAVIGVVGIGPLVKRLMRAHQVLEPV